MSIAKLGMKFTLEHRKNIAKAKTGKSSWPNGRKFTSEHCKNISLGCIGRKMSEETKRKISVFNTGRRHRPDSVIKMRDARLRNPIKAFFGKHHSPEVREKISIGHRGSKAYNWKGGVTEFRKKLRTIFEYRQWRSDVFHRDGFTCQACGDDTGGNLEADHVTPFASIIQKYEITTNDQARKCEALWDINNGRTLCVPCHKKTPSYGNKGRWHETKISS